MKTGRLLLVAAMVAMSAAAQRQTYELPAAERTGAIKRIMVLCHSHLDIGFTRPPDEVARNYKRNIDQAIELTRQNRDFKWTIEEAWMLEEWLRRTDDAALIAELGEMLRSGRMGFGAAFANMHSGLMSTEEANRLVYLGERFRKKFGLRAEAALQDDVPGFSWAYPRILQQSGVKYLITGLNLFIGGGNSLGVAKDPFYWVGPDGSRVLTFFTYDSYVEGYRWRLSDRFSIEQLDESVPRRLAWLEKNGYKYDTYLLMASPGDNMPPIGAYRILQRMREWNRRHPELPMQMATADDFFNYLIDKYGDHFASAPGDATGHWETVKLRVPEAAAKMRQTSNMLPAAEMAASIASLVNGFTYPKYDLAEAWHSLLSFHEHTADAGGGWPNYFSRWDTDWSNIAHYSAALRGYSGAEQTFQRSILELALPSSADTLLDPVSSSKPQATVIVFNGLSWKRSGPVIIERVPSPLREGALQITDLSSGEDVPYETIPGTSRQLLIFAKDVPAIGYKAYRLAKAPQETQADALKPFPLTIAFNRAGWITSIIDAHSSRELSPADPAKPLGRPMIARGRGGAFEPDESGPAHIATAERSLTKRIEISRSGSILPLTTVTLYRDAPWVDLRFDIDLGLFRDISQGGATYGIALPFRSKKTFLDGAGFVVKVPEDFLPGGQAPQFTPVQFVHYQVKDWGATVANIDAAIVRPDQTFLVAAEGFATVTREEGLVRLERTEPRSKRVQSFRFRVAIQDFDMAQWKRFGAEANLPLRAVTGDGDPRVASQLYFDVDNPGVQMLAFKPAEFRKGWYVIRLQEIGGKNREHVKVTSRLGIAHAEAANLVEESAGAPLDPANLTLRPWETKTMLVQLARPK